ncbi:HAD family hydrolase [Aerococcaceae bacterium DSM 111176]|nr:HAD family hydrolase [Aerococcaceae bacterium DSM 111176]
MIKAIGFDLDDTLYDRYLVYENVYHVMEETVVHTQVPFEEFNAVYQQKSSDEYELFINGEKTKEDYQYDRVINTYQHFGQDLTENDAIIFNALYEYYRSKIVLRPGVTKLFKELNDKGYLLFILTNGTGVGQYNKLKQLGVEQYIDSKYWFISEEIGLSKPDLEIFQHVQDKLEIQENNIVFIGDHLVNDCLAAQTHGWQSIYFNFDNIDNSLVDCLEIKGFAELFGHFK